jgi:DNA polymerase III subunit delta'
MTFPIYFNTKKTVNLFGLSENFNFIKNLYLANKLPKVLMLSGKKGSGKSTIINHLMYYIFDKDNYDEKNNVIKNNSLFYKQFVDNIYSNIIYLSGSDFKNIKVDDIRDLKKKIYQTSISDKPRFIILDDIELFNINSLNGLLKIIEEPTNNNHFLLINNKSKTLIETIKSRCLDYKVILSEHKRLEIINSLITKFNVNSIIDPEISQLTPGNFIKFNYICDNNKIIPNSNYLKNLTLLLNFYKKKRDLLYVDMILFLTDYYFNDLKYKSSFNNEKIIEYKTFIFENINKFFMYNLNQNALLNAITNKINDE